MLTIPTKNIINDGLVFYLDAGIKGSYPGSGTTWNDLAGDNNSTLTHNPTYSNANGGGFSFNGSNQFAQGTITGINTSAITFEVWVKPSTQPNFIYYPLSLNNISLWVGGYFSDATIAPRSMGFFVNNTTGVSTQADSFTLAENSIWNNVTATYQAGVGGVIYKNSNTIPMYSNSTVTLNASSTARVGARIDNSWYWNGHIAIARIYSRVLTAQEVKQNFEATRGRFGI